MMKAIVVEDGKELTGKLTRILESNGYQSVSTNACDEARKIVVSSEFDLGLVDNIQPDGSGIDTISYFRSLCPDMDIIAIVENNSRELEIRIRNLRVSYYLIKPIDFKEFNDVVQHLATRNQLNKSSASVFDATDRRLNQANH